MGGKQHANTVRAAVRLALVSCLPWASARAATLPIPCAPTTCGAAASALVSAGQASAATTGAKMVITQLSNSATLNWQSFNISADGAVQFVQPSSSAVALNRIYDSNPTQIFGALTANGQIYLINQNGIVFGQGAQVNVGSLVASTLDIDPTAISNGLVYPGSQGNPAFSSFANGQPSGAIDIQSGATLQSADGGQILAFAPAVSNEGNIHTPQGQTILAAGTSIYLASSTDSSLRGLLVEVQGNEGSVTNGTSANGATTAASQLEGQILAEDGNVTLAAMAVNQLGRVTATTSINENGSIRLQARQGTVTLGQASNGEPTPGTGGALTLGQNSDTEVTLDTDDASATVDSVPQPKSQVQLFGATVDLLQDSTVRATSGNIDVTAQTNQGSDFLSHVADGSRFYMAPGATLDVSGASAVLPVSDDVIAVKLEGTELADDPLQRNGVLHGETVYVDIRDHGVNPDGTVWWGTPLANVTGEIEAITRNVIERNLTGGTVNVQSQGDVILSPSSMVNVSGGSIQYMPGYLNTTTLLTANGQAIPIGEASPDMVYAGAINTTAVGSVKWGVTNSYTTVPGTYAPGYTQGYDAGTLELNAPAFVLDGSVNGSVVGGMYQRLPTNSISSAALGLYNLSDGLSNGLQTLYRAPDEAPQSALLVIGSNGIGTGDLVTGNVAIGTGNVLAGLHNADGSAFNPLTDPLPASYTTSTLPSSLLSDGEIGNVQIYSDDKFTLPANGSVDLPAGDSFAVQAGAIDLEGTIDIPGGSISAAAGITLDSQSGSLTLGPHASLLTQGEWINDSQVLYPAGNDAPLYLNGGHVTLSVAAADLATTSPSMTLDAGSLIDVSAGAQRTSAGTVTAGIGGDITIAAETPRGVQAGAPPDLVLGSTLLGYGVYKGGKLSVSAAGVCIATTDCSGGDPTLLWLSPQFFRSGGFGDYIVEADQGGLSVAPGTSLQLQEQNLLLPTSYPSIPNAPTLQAIGVQTGVLSPQIRQPVSLSLILDSPATELSNGTPIIGVTPTTASLSIGAGALIQTDPLGQLTLESNTRIIEDGTLRAPGGAITLELLADLGETQYEASQAIWLGSSGVLDASGAAQIYSNIYGQSYGSVLPGGTVTLDAQRGYIELLPGSAVDVAGASGVLDINPLGGGVAKREQVASAGGTIELTAAEGMALGGAFEAAAGQAGGGADQPDGGTLLLDLDASQRNDAASSSAEESFPTEARDVIVSPTVVPTVVAPGSEVPSWLQGQALVAASTLAQGGFGIVSLRAAPLLISTERTTVPGVIDLQGGVTLSATQEVSLDAASYVVDAGTTATISAPFIEFGNSDVGDTFTDGIPVPTASGGSGVLDVNGGYIGLYGNFALQGIGSASFNSTGDLRLEGVQAEFGNPNGLITGGLYADGSINLGAQQIYPSTLTQFVISADPTSVANPTTGSITVSGSPGANSDLLSAGGSLTLSAAGVTQDGVLRAPFGTIAIDANSITLGAGSVTSTSADGLTIPFGTTQGGLDWVYPLADSLNAVYGTDGLAPPSQHINLNGANINIAGGATVDISGGGDLQAYEWINGTQGTQDVLASTTSFAIIPTLRANVAPFDPAESTNSTLQVGDSITLGAGSGVAPGTYILLPARYALLPGAWLVTPESGTKFQDIQPGQSFAAPDQGTIVSGFLAGPGLSTTSRTNGFDITPQSVLLQEAQYNLTSGNTFFGQQLAAANAAGPSGATLATLFRLPQDSGILAINASTNLTLDGMLETSAGQGGRGGEVDISSAQIEVSPDLASATSGSSGGLVLTTSELDQLGAQTLLLGGEDNDGSVVTSAQMITIDAGTVLDAPQLLLTAQDQINLEDGATISASSGGPSGTSLTLNGDGAFLGLSSGSQNTVTRSGAQGVTGTLNLASGSTINASSGSLSLDASDTIETLGIINIAGGDLAVQAPAISLGAAPNGTMGTVLGPNVLGAASLSTLRLTSASTISLYDGAEANAQNILIDAPGFAGFGSQPVTLTAANSLTLSNSTGTGASLAGTGSGSLTLQAGTIVLGGGSVATSGFSAVDLTAQGDFTAVGPNAGVQTSGDLTITAARVTTASGVTDSLVADGAIALLAPSSAPTASSTLAGLGGRLSVSGNSVELDTLIQLPSGSVTLAASAGQGGGVRLDSGAAIDVSGVVQSYNGVAVASPGGVVTLNSAGNIALASGSSIDVSGGAGGVGGTLLLQTPSGTVTSAAVLQGNGAAGLGATFSIDADAFNFQTLNEALNVGGFNGGRSFRLRGPGDLTVAVGADNAVTAQNVSLEADQGGIDVEGLIDASGSSGGSVLIAGAESVIVNGTIDAQANTVGGKGGRVELDLEDQTGSMQLGSESVIDVAGTDGAVLLRVPQVVAQSVLTPGSSALALDGTITGASTTTLEAFQAYANSTGVISTTDVSADASNPIYQNAVSFMAQAPQIAAALGVGGDAGFVVAPGVEIDATAASNGTGNLELDTPWNLYNWRFNDASGVADIPGILTLRATGGITFNASLSDGFAATSGGGAFTLPTQPGASWSYRIVGGADMGAAAPETVDQATASTVTIGAGDMVRTGTGFIDVAASGDFVLANQASVLYTAGVAGSGISLPNQSRSSHDTIQALAYPTDGGNISINVDGDIDGALTNQFVNAWLWRQGGASASQPATAWTVNFQDFQQGVGALAGGNVTVSAGGNITDLSVSIPTIGVQVGGTTNAASIVDVTGGGNLTVTARNGSLLGGSYYVGQGSATLTAGDDVGASANSLGEQLSPLIGLGDAALSVTARGGVQIAGIVNPSLLESGSAQGETGIYFSTYGATSSAALTSIGGDVSLQNDYSALSNEYGASFTGGNIGTIGVGGNSGEDQDNVPVALDVMPSTLDVAALSGNIDLERVMALYPSSQGGLQLLASQNVTASSPTQQPVQIYLPDADPATLPSVAAPQANLGRFFDIVQGLSNQVLPDQYAATPVHASGVDSATKPVEVVALNGSVTFPSESLSNGLWSGAPVDVFAGQDVVDLNLVAQNLTAADVTSIVAGRDIIYPQTRLPNGTINQDPNGIVVGGPGQLQLSAGRNVNLGTSNGIQTIGNLNNSALPGTGASVSVQSGVAGGAPQYAAFISTYVDAQSTFDGEVIDYVEQVTGQSPTSAAQAKQLFDALPAQMQRTFVEELFFDLLRTYGRQAADTGNNADFAGAYAAIQSLFPGANPNVAAGQTDPYGGDIDLYFSQIYTVDGGDISLMAPGGMINVGLALPPASYGISKNPNQLGIVADSTGDVNSFSYGDFEVNQSRVFAADGGNILVWSTQGNIDAGRGAKTALSASSANVSYTINGQAIVTYYPPTTGSGIQALADAPGAVPGDVDLFAPHGVVNANDAGIVAGNLTVAATAVLGTNNITVSGTEVGVPVVVSGLGATFASASSAAGANSNVAQNAAAQSGASQSQTPLSQAEISFLQVFVTGLGEANCAPDDLTCLQRETQSTQQHPQTH